MITVAQAKKALKNHEIKILGTKLEELKTKNPEKHQIFYNTWCSTIMCLYIFNHEDKTIREANWFDVDGKRKICYLNTPTIQWQH